MSGPGSVALLSAGLDSTVNLYLELERGPVALALTADYGQVAAGREVERAEAIAAAAGVRHERLDLTWYGRLQAGGLVSGEIPDCTPQGLAGPDGSPAAVWVPNRNGVLIAAAAAFAESLGSPAVLVGFNAEEAAAFPDNSAAFLAASEDALSYSTANGVKLTCHTIGMDKEAIVRAGERAGVPWHLIWSCYRGGERMCGRCQSCARLRRALRAAGLDGRTEFDED